jgi:hypothetical protein
MNMNDIVKYQSLPIIINYQILLFVNVSIWISTDINIETKKKGFFMFLYISKMKIYITNVFKILINAQCLSIRNGPLENCLFGTTLP